MSVQRALSRHGITGAHPWAPSFATRFAWKPLWLACDEGGAPVVVTEFTASPGAAPLGRRRRRRSAVNSVPTAVATPSSHARQSVFAGEMCHK